jgi:hypothetical protein
MLKTRPRQRPARLSRAIGASLPLLACALTFVAGSSYAVRLPGQGQLRDPLASEDFEDPAWVYTYNNPKSQLDGGRSANIPAGESTVGYTIRGTWYPRFIEDTYRGHPDTIERTTARAASGAAALRLSTVDDSVSRIDAVSWQQRQAVTPEGFIPASEKPSAIVRVYVPDPKGTPGWGGEDIFLLMGMVGGSFGQRWPWCGAHEDENAPGFYTWACWTGGGTDDDPFIYNTYTNMPRLQIKGPGWWTIGTSVESNSLDFFIHEGLGAIEMSDHVGTVRRGTITEIYGMPGGTVWMERASTNSPMPDWIVDDMDFYSGFPPPELTIMFIR